MKKVASSNKKVLVIHGPNLNLLGEREPEIYGVTTLKEINQALAAEGRKLGITLKYFQSNSEGEIIDKIQKERKWVDGIIINPAAYTHYSIAIRDALASTAKPVVEVHLSDVSKRESFRKISVIKEVCIKVFFGNGLKSYLEGLSFLESHFR